MVDLTDWIIDRSGVLRSWLALHTHRIGVRRIDGDVSSGRRFVRIYRKGIFTQGRILVQLGADVILHDRSGVPAEGLDGDHRIHVVAGHEPAHHNGHCSHHRVCHILAEHKGRLHQYWGAGGHICYARDRRIWIFLPVLRSPSVRRCQLAAHVPKRYKWVPHRGRSDDHYVLRIRGHTAVRRGSQRSIGSSWWEP